MKTYPKRRGGGFQAPDFEATISRFKRYFQFPQYSARSARGGGERSTVICGPTSLGDMGTDADRNKPAAIREARKRYGQTKIKSGHLLNASFGGDGKRADNLTILTAGANVEHQNFDEPLKKALASLTKAYKALHDLKIDIGSVKIGILIKVELAGEQWGDETPDKWIFSKLKCEAAVVGDVPSIAAITALTDAPDRPVSKVDLVKYSKAIAEVVGYVRLANGGKKARIVLNLRPAILKWQVKNK